MKIIIKFLASIISALIGILLIPILAFEFPQTYFAIFVIYFLPGFSIGLIILFELLTRIPNLNMVYNFIQGPKMFLLFIILLVVEWVIIWQVKPMNDLVFASMFATATIPAIMIYNWLGKKWRVLPNRNLT